MEKPDIGVIGGGAVGLLTAYHLSKAGYRTTVYVRRIEQAELINRDGIIYENGDGVFSARAAGKILHQEELSEQVVFLAVKQYDLPDVMGQVTCGNQESVVFLQNGMSHISWAKKLRGSVFVGVVEHGVYKKADNHVFHAGRGRMKISAFSAENRKPLQLWGKLTETGYPVAVEEDWYVMLAEKLMINAVINPLTALYRVRNGALLKNSHFRTTMDALFEEAFQVADLPDKERIREKVIAVCSQTASNTSSMFNDILHHRKTEIDAISGYVLERAREKGMELPVTSFVFESIKGLEKMGGSHD
ncbi:2-dehydropantoate 2-reductase [Bacillus marinisedimentorum]|uniref:2-dehydropantoate 2-reductase n=1 Tax=Bacillus marinisedimentorum TaxID=1821260 RepID=UPI00087262F6|nr:2-dehydropantoate 2-reductase [Bacillus marinisedimentorum]